MHMYTRLKQTTRFSCSLGLGYKELIVLLRMVYMSGVKHGDVDWNAVGGNHLALKDGDNSTACACLKASIG